MSSMITGMMPTVESRMLPNSHFVMQDGLAEIHMLHLNDSNIML